MLRRPSDPNQPRNVEEEAVGTMCSVPMRFLGPTRPKRSNAFMCKKTGKVRVWESAGAEAEKDRETERDIDFRP